VLNARNDYVQFYAGALLTGTGELYSQTANERLVGNLVNETYEGHGSIRPPFHYLLFKPFTALPYRASFLVYSLSSMLAVIWFAAKFRKDAPALPLFVCFSLPLLATLMNGQDCAWVLVFAALTVLLARSGRDFLAGLVLSLCAIKFHLFVFVPFAIVLSRRWMVAKGAFAGGAVLIAASFYAGGLDWPRQYAAAVLNSTFSPGIGSMPNLRGLVFNLTGENAAALTIATALVVLFYVLVAMRAAEFELRFAYALVAGLLTSYHAYMQDGLLLLVSLALFALHREPTPVQAAAVVAVSPLVCIMLLTGGTWSALVPAAIAAILILGYLSRQNNSASDLRT
jgi:hypothetical protein